MSGCGLHWVHVDFAYRGELRPVALDPRGVGGHFRIRRVLLPKYCPNAEGPPAAAQSTEAQRWLGGYSRPPALYALSQRNPLRETTSLIVYGSAEPSHGKGVLLMLSRRIRYL